MEHLLSEHVANFQLDQGTLSEGHLGNDARLRSAHEDARSQIDTVQRPRLAYAMTQALSDPTVRERHFTTPTALLTAAEGRGTKRQLPQPTFPPDQDWNYSPKGKGKSKGKLRANPNKGKGKGSAKADVKLLKTPDNKTICQGYNRTRGCTLPQCKAVHVCNRCLGGHPCFDKLCPNWVQRGG